MVAKHLGSTRHTALVTTRLADDRGRLSRDSALVDRGQSLHNLAIGRYHITRIANKLIALLQRRTADGLDSTVHKEFGRCLLACLAQAVGLRLATSLSNGLRKIGKQQGDEKDKKYPDVVSKRALLVAERRIEGHWQHDGGANLHREHDWVLDHLPWVKLHKRLLNAFYNLFFLKKTVHSSL